VLDVKEAVEGFVADINANIEKLPTRGPASKYAIEDCRGRLELTWGEGFMEGIACSIGSDGYNALMAATNY